MKHDQKIGKQPPLKLRSAKINPRYIQDIQDKYLIPSGRRPSPARPGPSPGPRTDFNLSEGCFPICLRNFYKLIQKLYDV